MAEGTRTPGSHNGYAGARFLRETPYATVTEWSRAILAAIPEAERCPICEGTGNEVIFASNGGVGEVARCWACGGSRRRTHYVG
jgi:hypothetical protein